MSCAMAFMCVCSIVGYRSSYRETVDQLKESIAALSSKDNQDAA